MEIHFEEGLKRPRDATESAKLVSEAAVAVRCHAPILPTWIQYRNEKDNTQFNTFLGHLSVSMLFIAISNIVLLYHILSSFLLIRLTFFFQQMRFKLDPKDDATKHACTHVFQSALRQYGTTLENHFQGKAKNEIAQTCPVEYITDEDWTTLIKHWTDPKYQVGYHYQGKGQQQRGFQMYQQRGYPRY